MLSTTQNTDFVACNLAMFLLNSQSSMQLVLIDQSLIIPLTWIVSICYRAWLIHLYRFLCIELIPMNHLAYHFSDLFASSIEPTSYDFTLIMHIFNMHLLYRLKEPPRTYIHTKAKCLVMLIHSTYLLSTTRLTIELLILQVSHCHSI